MAKNKKIGFKHLNKSVRHLVFISLFLVLPLLVATFIYGLFKSSQSTNAQVVSKTNIYKVGSLTEIGNLDGGKASVPSSQTPSVWIGVGENTSSSILGMVLRGDALPSGARIQSATLEFTAAVDSSKPLDVTLLGLRSTSGALTSMGQLSNSAALTSNSQTYTTSQPWKNGEKISVSVTGIVQELSSGATPNNFMFVIRGNGERLNRRYIIASTSDSGPLLRVSYETGSAVPSQSPIIIATPTPRATPTPSVRPSVQPSASPIVQASPTPVSSPTGGIGDGFGPGSGDGKNIGLKLAVFNQIKADAAAGMYDRACTAAEHDHTKWHPLVNTVAKCHYDHEHGDDPSYVDDIFGKAGTWFGNPGQSISFPWQTFSLPATMTKTQALSQFGTPGQKENDVKHQGYYWLVRRDQTCAGGEWCITDSRLLAHFMTSHYKEVAVRFHGFSFEGRLCRNPADKSTCGIYRTAGWTDHGNLLVMDNASGVKCWNARNNNPITGTLVPLPVDNQFFRYAPVGLVDEGRCHRDITSTVVKNYPNGYPTAITEWWTHGASDFRYVISVFDPISNVDHSTPDMVTAANKPFCSPTDVACRWNNSVMTVSQGYTTQIWSNYGGTPSDRDGNGVTDLGQGRAYLNRFGDVNRSCTSAGLDCIPIEASNVILNNNPAKGEARYQNQQCDSCVKLDHDLTPTNRPSWISWFFGSY